MPHGAGHHHHGHHHHHHHHQVGGLGYRHRHRVAFRVRPGGTAYNWYLYRRPIGVALSSLFTIVAIVVILFTAFHYATPSDYSSYDGLEYYSAMDTRIIPVSKTFCQRLELTADDFSTGYTASLYMLDSHPTLTGQERFSVDTTSYASDIVRYYYYLYPGSEFTVSACFNEDLSEQGTFYLIKGHNAYNKWFGNNYNGHTQDSFILNTHCSSGTNNSHSYSIEEEDFYYLAFHSHYNELVVHMNFFRTLYELPVNSSAESCSVTTGDYGSTCSVSVPFTSKKTAFLTVTPGDTSTDWTLSLDIYATCVPRIWMYVVICLSCLMGVLLIMVPLSACIIIKCCKKKKTPPVTSAESANAPLLTANPHLQQPQYGYGSNDKYTAPPAYEP